VDVIIGIISSATLLYYTSCKKEALAKRGSSLPFGETNAEEGYKSEACL